MEAAEQIYQTVLRSMTIIEQTGTKDYIILRVYISKGIGERKRERKRDIFHPLPTH